MAKANVLLVEDDPDAPRDEDRARRHAFTAAVIRLAAKALGLPRDMLRKRRRRELRAHQRPLDA